MKACRSGRPEISDSNTSGSTCLLESEVVARACAVEVRLAQPLDLDFADELVPIPRRSVPWW